MQKFNLGNVPKNFKREVIIMTHDGHEASLEMLFKYRTRSQYGKLIDDFVSAAKATAKATAKANQKTEADPEVLPGAEVLPTIEENSKSMTDILKNQDVDAIDFMLKIADGWELKEKFGKEALLEMQDKFPGAFLAINEAYRASILEGRLKN